ncbi:MAG: hypothetical protein ACOC32_05080 [Nanoarchaeota archaeon]
MEKDINSCNDVLTACLYRNYDEQELIRIMKGRIFYHDIQVLEKHCDGHIPDFLHKQGRECWQDAAQLALLRKEKEARIAESNKLAITDCNVTDEKLQKLSGLLKEPKTSR